MNSHMQAGVVSTNLKSLVTLVCILHTHIQELEIALKFESRAFTPPKPDRQ